MDISSALVQALAQRRQEANMNPFLQYAQASGRRSFASPVFYGRGGTRSALVNNLVPALLGFGSAILGNSQRNDDRARLAQVVAGLDITDPASLDALEPGLGIAAQLASREAKAQALAEQEKFEREKNFLHQQKLEELRFTEGGKDRRAGMRLAEERAERERFRDVVTNILAGSRPQQTKDEQIDSEGARSLPLSREQELLISTDPSLAPEVIAGAAAEQQRAIGEQRRQNVKTITKLEDEAWRWENLLQTLPEMRRQAESATTTGPGLIDQAGRFLANQTDSKERDALSELESLSNSVIRSFRSPGEGVMSDSDVRMLKQSLPSIYNPKSTNLKRASQIEKLARMRIARNRALQEHLQNGGSEASFGAVWRKMKGPLMGRLNSQLGE